jgi:flavorubredoxin
MPSLLILYNTKTGNTEKMAQAVEQGAKAVPGVQVTLAYHATPEDLQNADAVIIGAPTYNHQVTLDIQTLLEKAAQANITLKDKAAAAFGSYGWSGEAPKQVAEILKNKFHASIIDPPILANYAPDAVVLQQCQELGKKVAQTLTQDARMQRE